MKRTAAALLLLFPIFANAQTQKGTLDENGNLAAVGDDAVPHVEFYKE